jgi:hypothetical protein
MVGVIIFLGDVCDGLGFPPWSKSYAAAGCDLML